MKNIRYILLALKGMAMGAADVVPGVSGGTIAFIAGIYGELVDSIKSLDLTALKLLFTLRFGQFWKKINGNFLFAVLAGIAVSIFTLARAMKWLLENEPIATWSFFFGLIVASSLLVSREIKRWNATTAASLVAGIAAAWLVTSVSPATTPDTWWFIALSGAIAICAMILPGISGAFILLLMGKYHFIMTAVSELDVPVIALFAAGALAGITGFSHLLSWLLHRHHNLTIALLTGFMIGSLNKVWPWKEVLETWTDSHGVVQPLVEANVWPGAGVHLWQAAALGAAGFLLIFAIEAVGKKMGKAGQL